MVNNASFVCSDSGCHTPGPPLSKQEVETLTEATSESLRKAIGEEIGNIVSRGVSIPTLLELARFAHTAQELLMIRSPIAEVRRRKRIGAGTGMMQYAGGMASYGGPGGFVMSPYQNQYGYEEDDPDVDSLTTEAAQNETFGAKMTREVISALGALKRTTGPTVQELIDSIKQAKDAGLDNIVAKLEASLDAALAADEGAPATPQRRRPRIPIDTAASEPEQTDPAPTNGSAISSAQTDIQPTQVQP